MNEIVKTALIFGITGQTGSFLVQLLLEKGYVVHGVLRRSSSHFTTERIDHIFDSICNNLHYGDILDCSFVHRIIQETKPTEIYNLAAQSHVKVSFEIPEYTSNTDFNGVLNILNAIKLLNRNIKFYQAGTSEMFGGNEHDYSTTEWEHIQNQGFNEKSKMIPKSPYGVAKLAAFHMIKIYRDSYGLFASNGILFNHESERRDPRFVTRKVTSYVANYCLGKIDSPLVLGNLDAKRDWGHAKDYAEAIYLIMQHREPIDCVIATNKVYSVKNLIEIAFKYIGIDVVWNGTDSDTICLDKKTNNILVKCSSKYFRPNEVDFLKGDYTLANTLFDWKPKINFKSMIEQMVQFDINNLVHENSSKLKKKV